MEKTIAHLKKFKELYTIIAFFIAIIWSVFSIIQKFQVQNDEMFNTLKTTQQMALKAVIWNDNIPLAEKSNVCDVYLSAGYNSLTKKRCELILNNTQVDQDGIVFVWKGES